MTSETLRYKTSRADVWRFYWRQWRQKLWITHAAIVALAAFLAWQNAPKGNAGMLYAATPAILLLAGLIAYPQLRYKPQERELILDTTGIRTTIGKKSGEMTWQDVSRIDDAQGIVYIQRHNGNAFIIPKRAFASSEVRSDFIQRIRQWWNAANK